MLMWMLGRASGIKNEPVSVDIYGFVYEYLRTST